MEDFTLKDLIRIQEAAHSMQDTIYSSPLSERPILIATLTGFLEDHLSTDQIKFVLDNMHMQNDGADIPLAPYLEK